MHRDIRPQNIFLTSKGNIKLGSFRSSKVYKLRFIDILRINRFSYNCSGIALLYGT